MAVVSISLTLNVVAQVSTSSALNSRQYVIQNRSDDYIEYATATSEPPAPSRSAISDWFVLKPLERITVTVKPNEDLYAWPSGGLGKLIVDEI